MNELTIISTPVFNDETYDVYSDGNRIFMTRTQIGRALGYEEPRKMIAKIHERHSDRLNKFSTVVSLGTVTGNKDTYLYNQRGIMEICRWSRQPIADKFMDWVWDIIETYRNGDLLPHQNNTSTLSLSQEQIEAIVNKKLADFKANELSHLKEELLSSYNPVPDKHSVQLCATQPTQPIIQEPIDMIRATIEPLAKSLNDHSKGYTCTFRKVYSAMNVSWTHRLSRYRNQHNNKNKPSKSRLIANDPKLFKLFVDTVNGLIQGYTTTL